ncbi:MAG: phosphoglucosamine mutase, partial [Luteolibacter sp.]
GDGILSALQVLRMMRDKNATLATLASIMQEYPNQLANIPVPAKPDLETLPKLKKLMKQATKEFGEEGRHLIRYSGTEKKLRVLVEHREIETARLWVSKFAAAVRDEIGTGTRKINGE